MKHTLIAIAAALITGSAFATTPVVSTGNVTGSATSQVSGATSSFSVANGVNQYSAHGSFAAAANCTTVMGVSLPGTNGAIAGTLAVTSGKTLTGGAGVGTGATYAAAQQFGMGTVLASANITGNATGVVTAGSTVATGTFSEASTVDSEWAMSGSKGKAVNGSFAMAGSSALENGVSVQTAGFTAGKDSVKTWGNGTGITNAGGTLNVGEITNVGSFQSGTFDATITREFTNNTDGVGGPGGCVGSTCGPTNPPADPEDPEHPEHPKKPKGNNGLGNGDQPAPGNSLDNNGAENSGDGPHPGSKKPRRKD